jgi:hypothetical protein
LRLADATRVASYNPWVSLAWLVTGRTLGGLTLYPARNRLDREQALRLWTQANTWFSTEQGKKGQILAAQLADLVVLDRDFFSVPEDEIQDIESVLTLLGGKAVHGVGPFADMAPPLPTANAGLVAGADLRRLPETGLRRWRPGLRIRRRLRLRLRQRVRRPWRPSCRRAGRVGPSGR